MSPFPRISRLMPSLYASQNRRSVSYLRDTLLVLSAEQDSPGNSAGVLALEEEGFGLSILESEDLGVTADVELALYFFPSAFHSAFSLSISLCPLVPRHQLSVATREASQGWESYLSRVDLLAGEGIVVSTHFDWCTPTLLLMIRIPKSSMGVDCRGTDLACRDFFAIAVWASIR